MKECIECGKELKHGKKYCSIDCRIENHYKENIEKWLTGKITGHKDSKNRDLRGFVRRYVYEAYEYKCSICEFSGINSFSKKTVLQIDHIDGNSENSKRENLRPLCPNCHAMTENYMGLNRGKSTRNGRYK